MTKRDFIQQIFIRSLPSDPTAQANCVAYAEKAWGYLTEKGYGDKTPSQPRANTDYYKRLNTSQKKQFDEFWKAFNLKKAKLGAAMRWHQMGTIAPDTFQHILHAAKKEAEERVNRPAGSVPIMAQGWLNQMRWQDVKSPKKQKVETKNDVNKQQVMELRLDLAHQNKQYELTGAKFHKEEAGRIETKLKAVLGAV